MLIKATIFLADTINDLQNALNSRDIPKINEIMPKIFKDYDPSYARALIAYNDETDIHAADIVSFHCLNHKATFKSMFCFDEGMVKFMCNHNMNEYFRQGA